jgi:AhpD family alkylhydroperoxidase
MKDYQSITNDISEYVTILKNEIPHVMDGFSSMAKGALSDQSLDKKTKEFVALGIAVSTRCDGCIGFHTKALVQLGATRDEILDVLGMAIYMGGGPSLMYAADALRSFDQFLKN